MSHSISILGFTTFSFYFFRMPGMPQSGLFGSFGSSFSNCMCNLCELLLRWEDSFLKKDLILKENEEIGDIFGDALKTLS